MDSGWTRITCEERDALRSDDQHVGSSLTNFVAGEVVDPRLPPYTRTEWWRGDGAVLIDRLDEDGCRHWKHAPATEGAESRGVSLEPNPKLLSPDIRSYQPTRNDPARVAEPEEDRDE